MFTFDCDRMGSIVVGQHLRRSLANLVWQQLAIPRLCSARKYDLVFFPAANRRVAGWLPCPAVGTFHDLAVLHVPHKYDWPHRLYSLRILPSLVKRLTAVITDSESSKRDLVEYVGLPTERVTVVPLGVDTSRYSPRDKTEAICRLPKRYGIRAPYLLYISRIEHPGKNHVRLIRAFDRLKADAKVPHQLVLAGSDWLGAEVVHQEAQSCKSALEIVFTGFVENQHLPDLYSGADGLVFPSLFEGFGLPILEAMSCGVPVACSDTSSLPEVAGDAAILFDPYSVELITEAMARLVTDSSVSKDLIKKGLQRCKEFTWRRAATQTAQVFAQAFNHI